MSKFTHAGRSLLEMLLILTISLVPMASGLLVMIYQLERKLEENAQVSVQEAIFAIDRVLDNMQSAASNALPLAGQPCSEAAQPLEVLAAGDPRIRSLILTRNGQSYCSSIETTITDSPTFYSPRALVQLNFDSPITPNGVVVELRLAYANPGVIATAYGIELRNELRGFQDGMVLVLEFGKKYIWEMGDSRDPQEPSQSEFFRSATSSKHGYTVRGGYPEGFTASEIRQSMLQILPSLALVGLLTGAITYWVIFRARNKGRQAASPRR
ncbi:CSS-motif domain-containing protein [Pseudomonas putida]|nr:CSS-motif domain-containing protein [Pseudomonas putida]EKT4525105.1 CSS-motif domain-containing protein [Pseudomonas putida]